MATTTSGRGSRSPAPSSRSPHTSVTTGEAERGEGSLAFEPRHALDGGPDGLDAIRRLVDQLPDRLAPGGTALLEIGAGQAGAVRRLAGAVPGAFSTTLVGDLAGIERVVVISRAAAGA